VNQTVNFPVWLEGEGNRDKGDLCLHTPSLSACGMPQMRAHLGHWHIQPHLELKRHTAAIWRAPEATRRRTEMRDHATLP
jgi:hypothetical protein